MGAWPQKIRKGEARQLTPSQPFVEVIGADLRTWIAHPDTGKEELRQLLRMHGVVIFRDAELSPAEELMVNELVDWHAPRTGDATNFGWNSTKVPGIATIPATPEVLCQGNALLTNHHGIASLQLAQTLSYTNEGFHSDGVHNMQERMPVLTSMYCLEAPLAGGETHFACGRQALARAPAELRALARRLTVHYVYDETLGLPLMRDGIVRVGRTAVPILPADGSRPAATRTTHPLVRRHHESGEESLYISCGNIDYMEAPAEPDGRPAVHLDTAASYELVTSLIGETTSEPHVLYASAAVTLTFTPIRAPTLACRSCSLVPTD